MYFIQHFLIFEIFQLSTQSTLKKKPALTATLMKFVAALNASVAPFVVPNASVQWRLATLM